MNDTHGDHGTPWTGFDLDGTLAVYTTWHGINHIGKPIEPMVSLMKSMNQKGVKVKILTARVAPRSQPERPLDNPYWVNGKLPDCVNIAGLSDELVALYNKSEWTARDFIIDWCQRNLGFVPEITHEKDHLMVNLYDDRVTQVIPNEGVVLMDAYRELGKEAKDLLCDLGWARAKLQSKINGFCAGLSLGLLLMFLSVIVPMVCRAFFTEKTPDQVRVEKAHDALCDLLNDWPEVTK